MRVFSAKFRSSQPFLAAAFERTSKTQDVLRMLVNLGGLRANFLFTAFIAITTLFFDQSGTDLG